VLLSHTNAETETAAVLGTKFSGMNGAQSIEPRSNRYLVNRLRVSKEAKLYRVDMLKEHAMANPPQAVLYTLSTE
jgi:hypothetical protein